MSTTLIRVSGNIGGENFAGTILSGVYTSVIDAEPVTLPAAKTGRLTTRTDNNTGVLTMDAGHGIVTGKINLHWDISGTRGCRRNMDGTVTDNSIAVDGGDGDSLPADESPLTAIAPTTVSLAGPVAADTVTIFGAQIENEAHCVISLGEFDTAFVEGGAIEINDGIFGPARIWTLSSGDTSPVDGFGDLNQLKVSQGGTVATSFKLSLGK